MNASFTGTRALVRLALRRDRLVLPAWLAVFVTMAGTSASATVGLFPSLPQRVEAAETFNHAQSLVALYGHIYDPTSIGALAMVKMGGLGSIFVALLATVIMVRHTRAEEESGRMELLGATVVGRYAPLTAAFSVTFGASAVLGLVTAVSLIASGLPVDGSFAFGLAWAGVGTAFAAIAGVVAQLTTSARAATGLTSAVLGVVYLLRAIGDTADQNGPQWMVWLSPIGWGQQFRPYAGNRWWVLMITVSFAVVAAAVAYLLVARRDLGAGLLPQRPGPPTAAASLASPFGLAWRLHRATLFGWVAAFAVLGLVFGNIATLVGGFLTSSPARDFITKLGGTQFLTDAYLAAILGFVGIFASAYGIQATTRLRAEESALRVEPVLATGTSRLRWAASHIVVAMLGVLLLMAVAGAAAGLAYGLRVDDLGQVGRLLGAGLAQVPAAWVLTGIVVAAFGFTPRWAALGWVALVGFILLGEVGPLLRLSQPVMDISPFSHTPRLPGGPLAVTPLVALVGVTALLLAAGLAGFRRRDVPVT
jgi:polyether ionophore transport system permease protein